MSTKVPTLVILSPGFAASEADDTCLPERQVFVRSLKEQYPSIHIIVLAFHYPYMAKEYGWNGVTVKSFGGKNKGWVNRLLLWLNVWRTLQQLNEDYAIIGLLHFWLGECALVGCYFAKRYGLKQYSWLLGQDARNGNKYAKWMKPKAEQLIALSDFLADEFFRNYHIRPRHIITPGIATKEFGTKAIRRSIDILGAGSLIPLKQYHWFIEVVKALAVSMPHIKAVICGKGPEKHRLQQYIRSLRLEKNITLLDEVPHAEVLQLMQQAKVFLHPSSYEGWSTVCMEALYAGTPVVAFCQPMKESIPNMHIASNKEDMVRKVHSLLLNGQRMHQPVLPYAINDTVAKIRKLYLG